jgi:hypothetical protein
MALVLPPRSRVLLDIRVRANQTAQDTIPLARVGLPVAIVDLAGLDHHIRAFSCINNNNKKRRKKKKKGKEKTAMRKI